MFNKPQLLKGVLLMRIFERIGLYKIARFVNHDKLTKVTCPEYLVVRGELKLCNIEFGSDDYEECVRYIESIP